VVGSGRHLLGKYPPIWCVVGIDSAVVGAAQIRTFSLHFL